MKRKELALVEELVGRAKLCVGGALGGGGDRYSELEVR